MAHVSFLREEFASMVGKGQWMVFSYSLAKELQGLRLSPLRVKEEIYWQPRWI